MSGLSSSFSRPRKTNGATANIGARGLQTPEVSRYVETPIAVRAYSQDESFALLRPHLDNPPQQSRQNVGRSVAASTPASHRFSPLDGGGQ